MGLFDKLKRFGEQTQTQAQTQTPAKEPSNLLESIVNGTAQVLPENSAQILVPEKPLQTVVPEKSAPTVQPEAAKQVVEKEGSAIAKLLKEPLSPIVRKRLEEY